MLIAKMVPDKMQIEDNTDVLARFATQYGAILASACRDRTLFCRYVISLIYASLNDIDFNTLVQLPSIKGWISIVFQALVVTLFGYAVWTQLISKHGLAIVTPYSLLVPISGLFFAWLFYGEILSGVELVGSELVLLGLMLLTIKV